jgi:hypothetical protein
MLAKPKDGYSFSGNRVMLGGISEIKILDSHQLLDSFFLMFQ